MIIQQLSVFLEDKAGRLTEITRILAENDINISAFTVAEASDYGILRLVVGRPELALKVLKENGFSVNTTEVIGIIVPHKPGGLYQALKIMSDNNISIDYMYAFALENSASVVFRPASIHEAIDVLQNNKMELLRTSQIYQI
jgi:hypothetical protein